MSHIKSVRKKEFADGMRDGAPIGLGYFAVSFALGISAKNAGITAIQSFVMSMLCNASAGEYAGISLIAADAAFVEVVLMTIVINARYLLMSCSMSQKLSPDTKLHHRLFIGFDITDEMFSLAVRRAKDGFLDPFYYYGAMLTTIPMWATGTAIGTVSGAILPHRIVSALSVALFGMFLAVIIPPTRHSKAVAGVVCVSFLLSFCAAYLPFIKNLSGGTTTIILTVAISAAAALLFPRHDEEAQP